MLLSFHAPPNELPKPFRQLAPHPPQQTKRNGNYGESRLKFRSLQESNEHGEGEIDEEHSRADFYEKF
jgi:hypothetical protein